MSTIEHEFKWPSIYANEVFVCGSFDNWSSRHELKLNNDTKCFSVSFPIPMDKTYYKFIVDGEWYTSDEDKTERDENGNVNNVLLEDVVIVEDYDLAMADSEEVMITHNDIDASSEFTSISHPNSETRWEEIEQVVEGEKEVEVEGEEIEIDYGEYDDTNSALNSSVQITLKDNSSVAGSIQSRGTSSLKKYTVAGASGSVSVSGDSIMCRIRSIFHKRDV